MTYKIRAKSGDCSLIDERQGTKRQGTVLFLDELLCLQKGQKRQFSEGRRENRPLVSPLSPPGRLLKIQQNMQQKNGNYIKTKKGLPLY